MDKETFEKEFNEVAELAHRNMTGCLNGVMEGLKLSFPVYWPMIASHAIVKVAFGIIGNAQPESVTPETRTMITREVIMQLSTMFKFGDEDILDITELKD